MAGCRVWLHKRRRRHIKAAAAESLRTLPGRGNGTNKSLWFFGKERPAPSLRLPATGGAGPAPTLVLFKNS